METDEQKYIRHLEIKLADARHKLLSIGNLLKAFDTKNINTISFEFIIATFLNIIESDKK